MFVPRACLVFLLAAGCAACAKLHARSPADAAPLAAPPPPPRVVLVPIESEPIVNSASPAVEEPDRRVVREPARDAAPPRIERPEPAAIAPAPLPATPPPDQAPAPPPPALQTTANAAEMERKARALLANAGRDLGRVDYRTLSADAKAQYDIAKRFSEQAEEALKMKNVVFAAQLADKAATLAGLLLRR